MMGCVFVYGCRGANALAKNAERRMPLHYHRGNPEITELLLQFVEGNAVSAKVGHPYVLVEAHPHNAITWSVV